MPPGLSAPDEMLRRAQTISAQARAHAAALDRDGAFPAEDAAQLAQAGLLGAVLPVSHGGVVPDGAAGGLWMLRLLHTIGQGSLALGRLFEAHVNALRLVMRYGTEAQKQTVAADATNGILFALWVTDGPRDALRMRRAGGVILLSGGKGICSGAGHAGRAVVTAEHEGEPPRMLLLPLNGGERVTSTGIALQGMRAATTGAVDFSGVRAGEDALLGAPGDYLRQPEFSTGAWRSAAVALGGLATLLSLTRTQLVARGRDGDPHQRARMGRAMIAHHTGWLWLERAACLVHAETAAAAEAVGYVNLARTAVEAACIDAMQAAQRSLGLGAYVAANPVEQLCRDLGTYLRQPAPDEALDEAAGWFMTRPLPGEAPSDDRA